MTMTHERAVSAEHAADLLSQASGKARLVAGGTDLLGAMKQRVHGALPELLVDLKTIPGLAGVEHGASGARIGALTSIADLERDLGIRDRYPALAEAAHSVASPHLRTMGTVGGNICQEPRCWYYRTPENVFPCTRKGGAFCNAFTGENRYHSVFGSMQVGERPCAAACPGNVEIPEYMELLRGGRTGEAVQRLLRRNPMPAVTGRVCPHPCQTDCNRARVDEAVTVRSVERYLGDLALDEPELAGPPERASGMSVAVVGSGPAGLSAAFYLALRGHRVVVFERTELPGGMLRYGIPSYRLPRPVLDRLIQSYEGLGVEFRCGIDVGAGSLEELRAEYEAVFIGTGAWAIPSIGLEGEEGLLSGIDFLAAVARGERRVPGPRLAVVGGGSVAFDVAVTARRLGAERVTVVCLENDQEVPALDAEVEEALREGIQLSASCGPSRLLRGDAGLEALEVRRCLSVLDDQACFAPTFDDADRSLVEADEVILAVGQRVETEWLDASGLVVAGGQLWTDPVTRLTSLPGVFAAGDAVTGPATVIAALGAGRNAADSVDRYLAARRHGGDAAPSPSATPQTRDERAPLHAFDPQCFVPSAGADLSLADVTDRSLDGEDESGLDLEAALTEARRCFNCGCVAVSPSDLAPALVALDATIVTSRRELRAGDFFAAARGGSTLLEADEVVLCVELPEPEAGWRSSFSKFRLRNSIDFAIVSVAVAIRLEGGRVADARIVLGAMAPVPIRAADAERSIIGTSPEEILEGDAAERCADAAVTGALPLTQNAYKTTIARSLVARSVRRIVQ